MKLPRRLQRLYGGGVAPRPAPEPSRPVPDDQTLNQIAEAGASYLERLREFSANEVIGAMVENGCPRRDAEQQMKHPGLSYYARQYYADLIDSRLGDRVALEKVERVHEAWGTLTRRREMQR